ncbi:MAG: cytochrome c oxidase assembly protein [Proteobacteria bacterium]|nr:cytochrome c oxidase assembly protein [Pseudomonadota bacterium]
MGILCATWLGPLPTLARTAFSPGMITHLSVVALSGPLIGYGLASCAGAEIQTRRALSLLLLVLVCDMAVVLGWHLPGLHDAAARSWFVFACEQITFLAVSIAVWYLAFESREVEAAGALVLFMIFMHMTILGCVLAIAPRLLYDPEVCRGAFGLTPLEDQRLGGVLMASWGAGAYLFGALVLFLRLMQRGEVASSREDV